MKRLIGSLLAAAFVLGVGTSAVFAASATTCPAGQTYTKPYTKADGTKVAGYCSAHKGSAAAPAPAATAMKAGGAMATSAASGAKGATNSMSTSAKNASSSMSTTSKNAAAATTCPPGKTYVNGYTKANGTKVAGYCRSTPSK
ncbi:MAG TPA: hypothetical protein VKG44_02945 [Candidatus Baltobacteraceae bacterium]|nr:hypothetical protein [Candidatus Baltobacteraceae bacterium]